METEIIDKPLAPLPRPPRGRVPPPVMPEPVKRTPQERVRMAVETAVTARNNARYFRRQGEHEAAQRAFWRAYEYLDLARGWRV